MPPSSMEFCQYVFSPKFYTYPPSIGMVSVAHRRALDASMMKLLSIHSVVDISSHSRGFHTLSVACCESDTKVITDHCAALVQKGGVVIVCDDVYDELTQVLCLYFMVDISHLLKFRHSPDFPSRMHCKPCGPTGSRPLSLRWA